MSNQGGITFDNIDWIEVISKHPVNNTQVVSWRNRNINYSEYSFWTPWRKIITEGKVEYVLTEPTQNNEVGHSTGRILRPKNIIINMDNLFFRWNIGYTDKIVYLNGDLSKLLDNSIIGKIINVKITDYSSWSLSGEVIKSKLNKFEEIAV